MNIFNSSVRAPARLAFTSITPAPRYYAHDIIDPIITRLKKSKIINLNSIKQGHPESGEVKYILCACSTHSNKGLDDPFAKVARKEFMMLKIDQIGNITLSQYIPTRLGRKAYGEITADPKKGNSKEFRSLLNTLIYELERYTSASSHSSNGRGNKLIRHLVLRDNPLQIQPSGTQFSIK